MNKYNKSLLLGFVPIILAFVFLLKILLFLVFGNMVTGRVEKRVLEKKENIFHFYIFISYEDQNNITHVVKEELDKKEYDKINYRDKVNILYLPRNPKFYILKKEIYNLFPLYLLILSLIYFFIRWIIFKFVYEK